MAQAPPDPYRGLDGLERAWSRLVDWLRVDLPRQWDELAGLLGLIGVASPPSGPPPPPPPPPIPPQTNRPYPIPDLYQLANLTHDEQIAALAMVQAWPIALAAGNDPSVALGFGNPQPNPTTVALALLGWEAAFWDGSYHAVPWGESATRYPNASVWFPGL